MAKQTKTMMAYQEKFGVPGEMSNEDVNALLAEMDPFLDGYFMALALERHEAPVAPVIDALKVLVEYDEKITYTRIDLAVKVLFEPVSESRLQKTYGDLTSALSAFMGSRFPNAEGETP